MPPVKPIMKKLITGAATTVGALTLADLTSPEESEAMTKSEFWKAVKPIYKEVTKPTPTISEQARLARSVRRLPKESIEEVKRVVGPEEAAKLFGRPEISQGTWSGFYYSSSKESGLPTTIGLTKTMRPATPLHEAGHELWRRLTPEERAVAAVAFKGTSLVRLSGIEKATKATLLDAEEFFAESVASVVSKSPTVGMFPDKLTAIIKKRSPLVGFLAASAVTASSLLTGKEVQAKTTSLGQLGVLEGPTTLDRLAPSVEPTRRNTLSLGQLGDTFSEVNPGDSIPENIRRAYTEVTGKDAPLIYPKEGSEGLPLWQEIALCIGAGIVAGGIIATLPVSGPAAAIATAALGGLLYGTSRETIGAVSGEEMEPPVTFQLLGEGPSSFDPFIRIAEETALWTAFPVIGKPIGKALKKLPAGIEWITHKLPAPVTEPITRAGTHVWENVIVKPFRIKVPGTSKSLQEMLQPAVERLEKDMPKVAASFRKAQAMKQLSTDVFHKFVPEIGELRPTELFEFTKGLAPGISKSAVKSPKVKDLLSRMEGGFRDLTLKPSYETKFRETTAKTLVQPLMKLKKDVGLPKVKEILSLFEEKLPTEAKTKDIHKMLDGIIRSPEADDTMKTLAKDLYNLPANTPLAAAKASRQASTEYILSDILNRPGSVASKSTPGYIQSSWPTLKGVWLQKDIELELQSMIKIPKIAEGVYTKWFLSPWKTSKVLLRPATHIRNLFSNLILNDWGGLPFYRVDIYQRTLKEMRNNDSMWREFRRLTGAGGTFAQQDIYQLETGLKYGADMFDKAYSLYEKAVVNPASRLYSAEENFFKLAKYIHNKELGLNSSEAALDAMKWTLNYGEITPEIAQIRKVAMPFATWTFKALPLAAETAVKHPLRFWKWVSFGMYLHSRAIDAVGLTDEEWNSIHSTLPDYLQKGLYFMMPWRDSQERLNLLNLTYIIPGIGDLNEFYQRSVPEMVLQNPLLTIGSTLLSKKKFSGAPLYYDWEPASTQMAKASLYVWEQLVPAPVPGGTDWNTLWRAVTEVPGALSPEQALASFFAFKLTPIDPSLHAKRKAAIRKIHEAEMTSAMQGDLRKARNPQESNSILKRYQKIREELYAD